jgi:hypothetical protein
MRTKSRSAGMLAIMLIGAACAESNQSAPSVESPRDSGMQNEVGDETTAADSPSASCDAAAIMGLQVSAPHGWDPLGYPPYALDGCTLVYVAGDAAGLGDLRKRNLRTGSEQVLAPASDAPSRPAASGETIAWEVLVNGKSQVRVQHRGTTHMIAGTFDHAGEPRVTMGAVAFTAWLGPLANDDTDVYVYDAENDALTALASGPGQQRFSDISATHVAVTDFSEDPRGYFDEQASLADIVVFERSTSTRIERALAGKQAFPMLGSNGAIGYLAWNLVHPEPKLGEFMLMRGTIQGAPSADVNVKGGTDTVKTDPAYVRPSVSGVYVDFIDTSAGSAALYRARLDAMPGATPVSGVPGSLLGPVAAEQMTLVSVGAGRLGPTFDLIGVAR